MCSDCSDPDIRNWFDESCTGTKKMCQLSPWKSWIIAMTVDECSCNTNRYLERMRPLCQIYNAQLFLISSLLPLTVITLMKVICCWNADDIRLWYLYKYYIIFDKLCSIHEETFDFLAPFEIAILYKIVLLTFMTLCFIWYNIYYLYSKCIFFSFQSLASYLQERFDVI